MQTSYAEAPAIGRVGAIADSRSYKAVFTKILAGVAAAGLAVFRVPSYGADGQNRSENRTVVYQAPSPAAALDVDAILATGASATAVLTTYSGTQADGVVGTGIMYPARKLTVTFSSSTDWDPTTGHITFYDQNGNLVTETLAVATSAALTTTALASQFVSMSFPAQTGTGGTFTIGIAVLDSSVTLADFEGVVVYDPISGGAFAPASSTDEYLDGDSLSAMRKGACWVVTEDACSEGGDVYVRVGGTGTFGGFRSDADSATAIVLTGARWGKNSSAGGLNRLEMY